MLTSGKLVFRSAADCVTRDRLTSAWFPVATKSQLLLVGALCLIFAATSFNRLHYTDLWGHLSFGRWMSEHSQLPTRDLFSATPTDQPYINSAWLAQRSGYETWQWGGNEGLVLAHALLATLAAAAVAAAVRARGCPLALAAVAALASYVLALPVIGTIRPQLFGMVGFAAVLWGCALLRRQRAPLLWLPLLMLGWANFHGSFLMGLVVMFTWALADTAQAWWEKNDDEIRRSGWMWLAGALSLAASFVNPHGYQLHLHVAGFGQNEILQTVSEWAALSTDKKLTLMLFSISFLTGGCVFAMTREKRRWSDLALFALLGFGTLSAIRMLAWWSLAWPIMVMPYVRSLWPQSNAADDSSAENDFNEPTAMQALLGVAIVFVTLLLAPCSHAFITGQPRGPARVLSSGTPMHVAHEIAWRNVSGNCFAPLDWADYLLWTSHGRLQPLVYTHVHLVEPAVWNDYVAIFRGRPEWAALARRHGLRYLLADRDPQRKSELAKVLLQATRGEHPVARVVYQDQKSIFVELLPERKLAGTMN